MVVKRVFPAVLILAALGAAPAVARAQQAEAGAVDEALREADRGRNPGADRGRNPGAGFFSRTQQEQSEGYALPATEKFRVRASFMAGYIHDEALGSTLGFEQQGRVGYAIVGLFGDLTDNISYLFEVNPVNETRPLPACGEAGYYYPNSPQDFGPQVACEPDGRLRVDDYRFLALDAVNQQGPIRQAYLRYDNGRFGIRFGRFILPIGLYWEDMGSFTAKDATHIQRINAEGNFGFGLDYAVGDRASVTAAAFVGDGNKFRDYTYFYFQDGSLDSNSALTMLLSARVRPLDGLEFRGAWKKGFTGSKVERLPNFFASKRHDDAIVLSADYRAHEYVRVFGEYARYTWGLKDSSAQLLGLDTGPLDKSGYYVGTDLSAPLGRRFRVGTVITREELSRDDSLIAYLGLQGFDVALGKKERSTAFRLYADFHDMVTVALIRHNHSNPYGWVSASEPIPATPASVLKNASDKWGLVVRFRLH